MQAPQAPMSPPSLERKGNPAFRTGLIFGGILAALGLAHALYLWATGGYDAVVNASNGSANVVTQGSSASLALGCLLFLVLLGLTFVAGIRAAGQTGKVGSGSIAGLITGILSSLVGSIVGIIVTITTIAPNLQVPAGTTLSQSELQAILIGATILGTIFGVLIDAGIGAGVGALGGLVGANNYRKAQPVTMYPGMPYAGYPPYGAPGYPPPPYPGYPNAPQAPQSSYPAPPTQPPYGTPPVGPQ